MKYAVVVIFKNQMKLEKSFKTKQQAVEVAQSISYNMESGSVCYFDQTYFHTDNILCVSWFRKLSNEGGVKQ